MKKKKIRGKLVKCFEPELEALFKDDLAKHCLKLLEQYYEEGWSVNIFRERMRNNGINYSELLSYPKIQVLHLKCIKKHDQNRRSIYSGAMSSARA